MYKWLARMNGKQKERFEAAFNERKISVDPHTQFVRGTTVDGRDVSLILPRPEKVTSVDRGIKLAARFEELANAHGGDIREAASARSQFYFTQTLGLAEQDWSEKKRSFTTENDASKQTIAGKELTPVTEEPSPQKEIVTPEQRYYEKVTVGERVSFQNFLESETIAALTYTLTKIEPAPSVNGQPLTQSPRRRVLELMRSTIKRVTQGLRRSPN